MNKTLKAGILLMTLAIPVFIWLFLKNFGQNQFALPVYYEESVPEISECDELTSPHRVSESFFKSGVANENGSSLDNHTTISYTLPETCDDQCQEVMENLANLQTQFVGSPGFQIIVFANSETYDSGQINRLRQQYHANSQLWKFVLLSNNNFEVLEKCGFLLSEVQLNHPLVMTDNRGAIRGYYEGIEPDEIDRLKGELKILFYMQETASYVKSRK